MTDLTDKQIVEKAKPDYREVAMELAEAIRIAEQSGMLPCVVKDGPSPSAVHVRVATYMREALAKYNAMEERKDE